MTATPTKQQLRTYMDRRIAERKPLPSQREIRRQLGHDLIEMQRKEQERRR